MNRYRNVIVDQARAWLGCKESDGSHKKIIDIYNSNAPLPRGYKVKYADAWCATFVSAVGIVIGYTDIILKECGCPEMIKLYQRAGWWQENDDYVPLPGDIIFYDWQDSGAGDNKGVADHVGYVESCDGKTIVVIEGNKNDACERRYLTVNGRYIRGYAVPPYDGLAEPPKVLTSANDITWELNHTCFPIQDMEKFVHALDEAKKANSSLYWGYYKLVNKIK